MKFSTSYKHSFWNAMRGNELSFQDIREGFNAGSYEFPETNLLDFQDAIRKDNLFRRFATVINLSNSDGTIYAITSTGDAEIVDENNSIPESADDLEQFPVKAYKIASMSKLLRTFISDTNFNLEKYLSNDFARRFGRAEENFFINGNGTTGPTGILTVTDSIDTKASSNISYDEVISLYFSLKSEYRKNAVFIMNDETAMYLRTLKDNAGNYLWNSNNNTIFGKQVVASPYMPSIETGKKPIAFGDLSYYWIIERQPLSVKVLNELYSLQGQVGFLAHERIDGKLIRPEAIKTIKML